MRAAQGLERPGVRVQAVGVDQQRQLERRGGLAARRRRRPRCGPGPGRAPPRRPARPSRPAARRPPAVWKPSASSGRPLVIASSSRSSSVCSADAGHRHLHVARARALGRQRGHGGRAGQARARRPRSPPRPSVNFEPVAGPVRVQLQHAARRSARRAAGSGAPRGTPISTTSTSPAWWAPGATCRPIFGPWKVARHRGPDRLPRHLAGGGVDARGHVAGHHGRVLGVDRGDGARDRVARLAGEPGAQQRVAPTDARSPVRAPSARPSRPRLQHVDLAALLAQEPGRHQAVAAVVALPDHDPHRPRRRAAATRAAARASPVPARSIRSASGTPCSSIAHVSTARISSAS